MRLRREAVSNPTTHRSSWWLKAPSPDGGSDLDPRSRSGRLRARAPRRHRCSMAWRTRSRSARVRKRARPFWATSSAGAHRRRPSIASSRLDSACMRRRAPSRTATGATMVASPRHKHRARVPLADAVTATLKDGSAGALRRGRGVLRVSRRSPGRSELRAREYACWVSNPLDARDALRQIQAS